MSPPNICISCSRSRGLLRANPLDPAGYDARRAASDFPGETFRVLKEKEIRQYGEYRTRRLVLEAWERLEASGEWPTMGGGPREEAARPAAKTEQPEPAPVSPPPTAPEPAVEPGVQPTFSDFGLYKCAACGKMVMGFEKVNHEQEKHGGKGVEWVKVK